MANIPYSGFNGAIATYSADTCISNISVTANAGWITVLNGNSAINGNVQANTTLSSRTATVTVGYKADATDCNKTFDVTQDARPCNCGDLTVSPTAMSWAYDETGNKTVTISAASCANITSVIIDSGDTTAFTASYNASTKKVTISPVGQNPGQTPYNAKLRVYYLDDCNKSVDLNQGIMGCSCNDLDFITPTSLSWASNEIGTKYVSYSADSCISNISVTHINTADFDVSLSTTNKEVSVTPRGNNPTTSAKTDTITLSYSAGTASCPSKTINATQAAHVCTCEDVTWTTIETNIPSGGTSAQEIASYSAVNVCDVTIVSGKAESTTQGQDWIKYVGVSNNKVTVSASTNEDLSNDRYGVVTITYKPSPNSEPCDEVINVSQTSVPCGCEYVSRYIVPIKPEFGYLGTHDEYIIVASGDTHGCGTLSANTSSDEMLEGGGVQVIPIDGVHYDRVYFKAKVKRWNETVQPFRTQGAGIIFIGNDSLSACPDNSLVLKQYSTAIPSNDCDDFTLVPKNPTSGCDSASQVRINVAEIEKKYSDVTLGDDLRIQVLTDDGGGWYNYSVVDRSKVMITSYYANVNPIASARTATMSVGIMKNNIRCMWSSCTFTQSGCTTSECNCEDVWFKTDYLTRSLSGVSANYGANIDLVFATNNIGNSFCLDPEYNISNITLDVSPSSASSWVYLSADTYGYPRLIVEEAGNEMFVSRSADTTLHLYLNGAECSSAATHVHQDGLCACKNFTFTIKIDGEQQTAVGDGKCFQLDGYAHDIELIGFGSNYTRCFDGITMMPLNPDDASWIHPEGVHYTYNYQYHIDENTGEPRNSHGIDMIVYGSGGTCAHYFYICQDTKSCPCTLEHRDWEDYSSIVYPDKDYYVSAYIVPSADCLSYEITTNPSDVVDITSGLTPWSDNRYKLTISASTKQGIQDGGCRSIGMTVALKDENDETCNFDNRSFSASSCYEELGSYKGTLTQEAASFPVNASSYTILGRVTGSKIGNPAYYLACWSVVATTESSTEVNDLRVEENNGVFEIKAKLTAASHPTVDVFAERYDACTGTTTREAFGTLIFDITN